MRFISKMRPWACSLGLHLALVGVALLSAYLLASPGAKPIPPTFVLVSGAGNNTSATAAPRNGSPVANPAASVDLSRILQHSIDQNVAKAQREIKLQREAEAKAARLTELAERPQDRPQEANPRVLEPTAPPKSAEGKRAPLTHSEFKKQQGRMSQSNTSATPATSRLAANSGVQPGPVARIDVDGIVRGVPAGPGTSSQDGANGTAPSVPNAELSAAYIQFMIQELGRLHEKPQGVSELLTATAEFKLSAEGRILELGLVKSSGNLEFDQSVLATFRKLKLPAPPANLKPQVYRLDFTMRDNASA